MAATIPPPRCTKHASNYEAGCTPCRLRSNWYNRRIRAHKRAGRWQPMVDITQVRQHINTLRANGMTIAAIARTAGISIGQLDAVVYEPNRRTVNPTLATILLTITPQPDDPYLLDPTGTRRRLRALQAIGWTLTGLATQLGTHPSLIGKWLESPTVTRHTAARAKDLYDRLAGTPGPSKISASRARAAGYLPPLMWGDDIDDPNAQLATIEHDPHLVDDVLVQRAVHGDQAAAARLNSAERAAAVERLTAADVGAKRISTQLGIHPRTVTRRRTANRTAAQRVAA